MRFAQARGRVSMFGRVRAANPRQEEQLPSYVNCTVFDVPGVDSARRIRCCSEL